MNPRTPDPRTPDPRIPDPRNTSGDRSDLPGALDSDGQIAPPPRDDLDAMLRTWHARNAEHAAAGRERLLRALAQQRAEPEAPPRQRPEPARAAPRTAPSPALGLRAALLAARRAVLHRFAPMAASLTMLVVLAALLLPTAGSRALAGQILVPEGGRLDALDDRGALIGPCPLEHTSVHAEISGRFTRVILQQEYTNPYGSKIEAVYTFPLSHRAAVDRMTMTVGDRVVTGEVKERAEARRIYQQAREAGYVASLLEQERPNIFTQSIANIEPGATVSVEISYVEILEVRDGEYRFDFPMVVAPRYIPGSPTTSGTFLPAELNLRRGVILRGPARLAFTEAGDLAALGSLQVGKLQALLHAAAPIQYPGALWWGEGQGATIPQLWYRFEATYADGSIERGTLHSDGTGQLNDRWFFFDPSQIDQTGTGFSPDTDRVPDASRITPMPVRPPTRAGHDISLTLTIDTGGPGLRQIKSELHEIVRTEEALRDDGLPRRVTLALMNQEEIPNRDFLLSWHQTDDTIEEAVFTHTGEHGNFFTLMLMPPARVEDDQVRARELIFVLDCSGSMKEFPIEKAKDVMRRAIDTMRPGDTFNVITFNNTAESLWDRPRPNSAENRAEARQYVESRPGGGGTEMKQAVLLALQERPEGDADRPLDPAGLANLPADGRGVTVLLDYDQVEVRDEASAPYALRVRPDLALPVRLDVDLPPVLQPDGVRLRLTGHWMTQQGERLFVVNQAAIDRFNPAEEPMRIVFFLTDGEVGDDDAIIDAVRANADRTRLFSLGIGNSPNRPLLDAMAKAGRGASDFISLEGDAEAAAQRFVQRTASPVLTDIELTFSEGLEVTDWLPVSGHVPDLFDASPIILHGKYTAAGTGTLRIQGSTGAGRYDRTIDLDLPAEEPKHDVIATLWARAKVDALMEAEDRAGVVAVGTQYQILTAYTSFVAVERSRVTIDGEPMLVAIPIEMVEGQSWEGTFGGAEGVEQMVQALCDAENVRGRLFGLGHVADAPEGDGAGEVRAVEGEGITLGVPMTMAGEPATEGASRASKAPPDAEKSGEYYTLLDNLSGPAGKKDKTGEPRTGYPQLAISDLKRWAEGSATRKALTSEQKELLRTRLDNAPALDLRRALGTPPKPALRNANTQALHDQRAAIVAATSREAPPAPPVSQPAPAGSLEKNATADKWFAADQVEAVLRQRVEPQGLYEIHQPKISAGAPVRVTMPTPTPPADPMAGLTAFALVQPESVQLEYPWQRGRSESQDLDERAAGKPFTAGRTIQAGEPTLFLGDTPIVGKALRKRGEGDHIAAGQEFKETEGVPILSRIPIADGLFRYSGLHEKAGESNAAGIPVTTLLPEQVVLIIASLVAENQIDLARMLAAQLVEAAPDFQIGLDLHATLHDESLDPLKQDAKIAALAEQARAAIRESVQAMVHQAKREARLQHVLDERLLPFAFGTGFPDELVGIYDGPTPEDTRWVDGGILITILMADLERDSLAAILATGAKIKDVSESVRLVVAAAPLGRLDDLAMLEVVRRIEPTQAK